MTGRTHEGRRNRETDGRREEREQSEGDRQAENERQTERETKSVKERVDSAARTERERQVERERERELGQRARHTVPYQGSVTVPGGAERSFWGQAVLSGQRIGLVCSLKSPERLTHAWLDSLEPQREWNMTEKLHLKRKEAKVTLTATVCEEC